MNDQPLQRNSDTPIILIIDDDPLTLKLLELHMRASEFQVHTAQGGREALKILGTIAPDIIITDWNMPECDGIELCKSIRNLEQFGLVFIIMLTSHTDEDRLVEAFNAGVDDYLTKPFSNRELMARLKPGLRIVKLERELEKKSLEITYFNAELEMANSLLEKANAKLEHQTIHDELTGLRNRRAAMIDFEYAWISSNRHDQPLSCVIIDIDHFKIFNDTYGHATGDLVLQSVARTLNKITRFEESMYRIGGEEFLVICPQCDAEMAAQYAERIRVAIEELVVNTREHKLSITISLGVAQRTPETSSPAELIKLADKALYQAKDNGRNCTTVSGFNGLPPTFKLSPPDSAPRASA